jgi:hypothetical protein
MGNMDDLFLTGNLTTSPSEHLKQENDGTPKEGERVALDLELGENYQTKTDPEVGHFTGSLMKLEGKNIERHKVIRRLKGAAFNPAVTYDNAGAYVIEIDKPVPPDHRYKISIVSVYSAASVTGLILTHNSQGSFYTGLMNQISVESVTGNLAQILFGGSECYSFEGEQLEIIILAAISPGNVFCTLQVEDINLKEM